VLTPKAGQLQVQNRLGPVNVETQNVREFFFLSLQVFQVSTAIPGGNRKQNDFGTEMTVGGEF
jgi:hypothetical protein